VTRELEGPSGWGLIDTPRIPTQNQEAELPADMVSAIRNGDVNIAPLFIQYKRSEWMKRSNAGEWDTLESIGHNLSDGYYRFKPYLGKNNQHNKLVELGKRQPLTFYASPIFHKNEEYLRYVNDSLLQHTAFIQCGNLNLIDYEDHYIVYTPYDQSGLMLSEPTTFNIQYGGGLLTSNNLAPASVKFETLRRKFKEIRELAVYDDEEYSLTGSWEPSNYSSGDLMEWFRLQRQFLTSTIDTDVVFLYDLK
jgi:hypothetical protein